MKEDIISNFMKVTGKSRSTALRYYQWLNENAKGTIQDYLDEKKKAHGHKLSEEEKKHLSEVNKGKKFSDEHRKHLSQSALNRPKSDAHKKAISETLKLRETTTYQDVVQQVLKDNPGYVLARDICDYSVSQALKRAKEDNVVKTVTYKSLTLRLIPENYTPVKLNGTSKPEQEIVDYIKSIYSGDIQQNTRQVIKPLELDIFIPEKKVAIEFDGLYWHSVDYKASKSDINYHLNKTIACEKLGIRLIHIFSDEWEYKQDIVKSIIASSLGIYQQKIFARKCEVKTVDKNEALNFIKNNHIQDTNMPAIAYGLYYNNKLVQVATFRQNFAQRKSKDLELARMCTLLDTQVVGGFSKLIKYALKNLNSNKVTSFVDRRLFNASGYKSSEWKVEGYSKPRYFYTDGNTRENRQKYMKQSCLNKWPEFNDKMTEEEMCYLKGLRRIYDCGCIKVMYE